MKQRKEPPKEVEADVEEDRNNRRRAYSQKKGTQQKAKDRRQRIRDINEDKDW